MKTRLFTLFAISLFYINSSFAQNQWETQYDNCQNYYGSYTQTTYFGNNPGNCCYAPMRGWGIVDCSGTCVFSYNFSAINNGVCNNVPNTPGAGDFYCSYFGHDGGQWTGDCHGCRDNSNACNYDPTLETNNNNACETLVDPNCDSCQGGVAVSGDQDRDGYCNEEDVFDFDPNAHSDMDSDGIPDAYDDDIDGDGYKNNHEEDYSDPYNINSTPPDNDYNPEVYEFMNGVQQFIPNPGNYPSGCSSNDCNYHTIPNLFYSPDHIDSDDDNDNVNDIPDPFPFDPSEQYDFDGDGVGDNADKCPQDPNGSVDSDGDLYCDGTDMFPDNFLEHYDTDGDGIGDNEDKCAEKLNNTINWVRPQWQIDLGWSGNSWDDSDSDGTCDEFEEIGCRNTISFSENASACNWTELATQNDESVCVYPVGCETCDFLQFGGLGIAVSQSFENTFNESKLVKASKGFYSDYVNIEWQNNNNLIVDKFSLERREYSENSSNSWALIGEFENIQHSYKDYFASSSILYEYRVIAESYCGSEIEFDESNTVIGFRIPEATVSGHIEYEGGKNVDNMKVSVQSVSPQAYRSVKTVNSSIDLSNIKYETPNDLNQFIDGDLTIGFWFKADELTLNNSIILKAGTFEIKYINENTLQIGDGNISKVITVSSINYNNWNSLYVVIKKDIIQNSTSFDVLINGGNTSEGDNNSIIYSSNDYLDSNDEFNLESSEIKIGGSINNYFNGYFDEIRVYQKALTNEDIFKSYDRYISNSDIGLVALYYCDEGLGSYIYDTSVDYNGNRNENHLPIEQSIFSTDKPSPNQLSNYSLTNEYGNYIIEGVRYSQSGNNFTITPQSTLPFYSSAHQFEPSQRVVYLGDQNLNSTGQNFSDISSFNVSGYVYYHDLHDVDNDLIIDDDSCQLIGVKDVRIKIDGAVAVENGEVVKTESDGSFTVVVPIGEHRISIEREQHTFSSGFYPSSSTYFDFQEDITGLKFYDNTIVKVAGRVVGGHTEADTILGFNLSTNNIGVATFEYQLEGRPDFTHTVTTNSNSGEYMVQLLPEKYLVKNFKIPSNNIEICHNPSNQTIYDNPGPSGSFDPLDLTYYFLEQSYDHPDQSNCSTCTVSYNNEKSFVYTSLPHITLQNASANQDGYTGLSSVNIDGTDIDLTSLNFPLFKQHFQYKSTIILSEIYTNKDDNNNHIVNHVPIDNGTLSIVNELSRNPNLYEFILSKNDDNFVEPGKYKYDFIAGEPNTLANLNDPNLSYLKTWSISFEDDNNNTVCWPNNDCSPYEGIVLGAKPEGTNFVTNGPQVVSHILRDPPGSNSYAFFENNSTFTSSRTYGTSNSISPGLKTELKAGLSANVGLGYSTTLELATGTELSVQSTAAFGYEGEYEESYSFGSGFETNSDPTYQGSLMDVYVGKSENMLFGITNDIAIIHDTVCAMSHTDCSIDLGNNYNIGKIKAFQISPNGYGTEFFYTQYEILYNLIPELERLRNIILETNPQYEIISQENLGLRNSDPIFGENALNSIPELRKWQNFHESVNVPSNFTELDSINAFSNGINIDNGAVIGPSYTFQAKNYNQETDQWVLSDESKIDSVYFFNQQIRLWQEAIYNNERLKVIASPLDTNISFDGGVGPISRTYGVGSVASETKTWEVGLSTENAFVIGSNFAGAESENWFTLTVDLNVSGSSGASQENETLVGFVLDDGDLNDKYSVDFLSDGTPTNGVVFKVKGGRTSCPYSGQEVTQFFNPGTELSTATVQMEQPTVNISPNNLINVPENSTAVFNLNLGNANPLGYDQIYSLKVVESSNPNGAIIKIDGLNPNRDFMVPAGTSINKTLTVEKGPNSLDYEDIKLVFHSTCQFDPTDLPASIFDTVSFSVNFLAGCTEVDLLDPDNNWIVNSTDEEISITIGENQEVSKESKYKLESTIGGYDINYYSLDNITFEYKPTNESDWISTKYYKNRPITSISESSSLPDDYNVNSNLYSVKTINSTGDPLLYEIVEYDTTALLIPTDMPVINHYWDLTDRFDGQYEIRAKAVCMNGLNSAFEFSNVLEGQVDRVKPYSFGTPSPADGILDSNDDVKINFNEDINTSILSPSNFSVKGVLNRSEKNNDASLFFNGNNFMNIPTGINLKNKSFTIEMSLYPISEGVLFSQGYADGDQLELRINSAQKLEFTLSGKSVSSSTAIDFNKWQHICLVYNFDDSQVDFLIDGQLINTSDGGINLSANYSGEGQIDVCNSFTGNIHSLRLWSEPKTSPDVSVNMQSNLSGNEPNLIGLWRMDELEGNPIDKARSRNAQTDANWHIDNKNFSAKFNSSSNSYFSSDFSNLSFTDDEDFTIEFWFKCLGVNQTILTNETISPENSTAYNYNGWTIRTNNSGHLEVKSNSEVMTSSYPLNDGNWHHLAIVKSDLFSTKLIIDGNENSSLNSDLIGGFGGANLTLGAKRNSYNSGNNLVYDYSEYLDGGIDELRIWNKARTISQINRDCRAKLTGNESLLRVYYPFEHKFINEFDLEDISSSINDHNTDPLFENHDLINNSIEFSQTDRPLIVSESGIKNVNYEIQSNDNQIIIDITDPITKVEGCIIDVEVKDVQDLFGNSMSSPEVWSFYVDKNQLIWDETIINHEKLLGSSLEFNSVIVNRGGQVENFEISNYPEWLTVSPSEGLIEPNSYLDISFNVNENLFVGNYSNDILLTGNNEFSEKLKLNIDVSAPEPEFNFNPNNYLYSMNFVGKIKVEEFTSRDENDIIFAYVDDEVRGYAKPIYISEIDAYILFLTVYSNNLTENNIGEQVKFTMWDASNAVTLSNVTINDQNSILFEQESIVGGFNNLTTFKATSIIIQEIPLNNGWNWISLNVNPINEDEDDSTVQISTVFSDVDISNISSFKNQDSYALSYTYPDGSSDWFGSLQSLNFNDMYMININSDSNSDYADTILYEGKIIDPSLNEINIAEGWSWIGYQGQKSLDINSALSSLNPSPGDIIKSKYGFSMFASESIGWLGSLTSLNPGFGYMINSSTEQTLIYPQESLFSNSSFRMHQDLLPNSIWPVNQNTYENSMSIVAKVNTEYFSISSDLILGGFNGNYCVGNVSPINHNGDLLYFLTLYGSEDDIISFNAINHKISKTYSSKNEILFENNSVVGTIEKPLIVDLELDNHQIEFLAYPNPFNSQLKIFKQIDKVSNISIFITDLAGRKVCELYQENKFSGNIDKQFDLEFLAQGSYLINLKLDDKLLSNLITKY